MNGASLTRLTFSYIRFNKSDSSEATYNWLSDNSFQWVYFQVGGRFIIVRRFNIVLYTVVLINHFADITFMRGNKKCWGEHNRFAKPEFTTASETWKEMQ